MVGAKFDSPADAAAHKGEVDTSNNVRRWPDADFRKHGEAPNEKQLQPSTREYNIIERKSLGLDAIVFWSLILQFF